MAKETTVIFVYDTELLKTEEDDPNSAILYFYPTWVSDQQKTSLCGQLMGTVRCLKSVFSMPKTLSLQTGKFFFIENDRYILAIGSDRNIPDWILEHRANSFYSLVNFFHKDFIRLASLYQRETLNAKLYHMFDTYLKLMMYGGNIFCHVSLLEIPKNGSTVLMEAVAFLDRCRELPNVLGGTILYNNKVVATHLSSQTTKKIILADPYRIKSPAEKIGTNFELPFGLQLLQVYITNKEFCSLLEYSLRSRCIMQHWINKNIKDRHSESDTLLKRDSSLLFTIVPEEDPTAYKKTLDNSANESVNLRQNLQKKSRPNSLNLKTHNFELNELNFKNTPGSHYGSQSSIVNTPMTEVKIFAHQQALSLMPQRNSISQDSTESISEFAGDSKLSKAVDRSSSTYNTKKINREHYSTLGTNLKTSNYHNTLIKKPLPHTSISLVDLSKIPISIQNNSDQYSRLKIKGVRLAEQNKRAKRRMTVHDATHPYFMENGMVLSQYYFTELSNCQQERTCDEFSSNKVEVTAVSKTNDEVVCNNNSIKNRRKSLTLPLKPLNPSELNSIDRKYSLGVHLTPLMNRLTLLAYEEQGKVHRLSQIGPVFTKTPSNEISGTSYGKNKDRDFNVDHEEQRECVLFVCGQQDVVLALLLQDGCAKDGETIDRLWELCTEQLPKFQKQINYLQTTNKNYESVVHDTEPYSFLHVDREWDTVKRGGSWDPYDVKNVSSMYSDFKTNEELSEIYLRNSESVLFGQRSGSLQVFYHESTAAGSTVLQPHDVVGLVKQKASRRLERDHSIVLS